MQRENWRGSQNICMGAMLASLAVVIQSSPLYIPILGVSLSAFSTLPVALAGNLNIITGILVYIISGILVSLWSVSQALIFFCTSGILGLSMGVCMKKRLPLLAVIIFPAILLSLGISIVGCVLKIPILPWLVGEKRVFLVPVVLLCTLLYSSIWRPIISIILVKFREYF